MSRLSTLVESETRAASELDAYTAELEAITNGDPEAKVEGRAWTKEESDKLENLQTHLKQVRGLKAIAETDEREASEEAEERAKKLGPAAAAVEGQVRVGDEPTTYGLANPENSFYRDLLMAASPATRGHPAALARLNRHQDEMDGIRNNRPASPEARALSAYDREVRRLTGQERRDVDTGSGSMGDFAPPLYFLTQYAPYRTYGRTFIDAMKHQALPETGMTFNVPKITTPTEGINQTANGGENMSVSTRDMTSTYEAGTLQTIIDNLLVSQQYLDRVGPGIDGDQIVRDDQQRQVNRALNLYAWQTLFATSGVGTNLYTDSAFNAYAFLQVVGKAKAAIESTDGLVAYPTHFITDVDVWETIEGAVDDNKRPYVVPQGVAFNPLATGDDTAVPEGYTGFRTRSLPAFKDQAEWIQWQATGPSASYHVSMVGALDIGAVWLEGTPVIRVLPQPNAATLTVLIQEYVYAAMVVVYAPAFQLIYGTGTASNLLTA